MKRILIELTDNYSVDMAYENGTFTDKCKEIVSAQFYVAFGDKDGSTMIARDHIIRIRDLGDVK